MDLLTLTLTKCFSRYKSGLCALAALALLVSCSTTKPSKPVKQVETKAEIIQETETGLTAEQLVSQAASQNNVQAVMTLLNASELYLAEAQPHKALWLTQQLSALAPSVLQQYHLKLIAAKSLLALEKPEQAFQALENAHKISEKAPFSIGIDYYQTLASIQTHRQLPIAALAANLRGFAKNTSATDSDIELIWQQLCQLSPWQHQQLVKMSPPHIKGWSQLLTFANKFGDDDARFNRYLSQWQGQFSTHPAQHIAQELREELKQASTGGTHSYQNIAVILPLSGKQERAGKVAQQGILAAYDNNSEKTLHFIDSTTLDMTSLASKFDELKIDSVIGPLLKENVSHYLAQTELTIPTLLLNLPAAATLLPHQVALSMRPEDEAMQAATTLSRQHYQQPLILSHQDKASRRIAQTFSQQWQHITGKKPELVFFNRDAKMQNQLKASLGVDLSQQRTKELNRYIKYAIKNELRNRRDIDMIYVVGLPLETKLLKTYIDVNISPFADLIPVYASSRSHSSKFDNSDMRDLSGLVFTEMPWQLTSNQQNKALVSQAKKLWPNRSDSLQTIFAMGYDSLALLDKVSAMQDKAYVRHYGQTGILQLGDDNILKRSLIWGKYSRSKVDEIAMD
ncbi:MAG: penicillin-binding protein activator [Cognaticolwellia sp.]